MKLIFAFLTLFVATISMAQKPVLMVTRGHSGKIIQLITTPDDKYIITSSKDNTVRIWERRTGRELKSLDGFRTPVEGLNISDDGKFLITGAHKDLRVYSIGDDVKLIFRDTLQSASVSAVAFNSGGTLLAAAEDDYNSGTHAINIWNTNGFSIAKKMEVDYKVSKLQFAASGELLATRQIDILHINTTTGIITHKDDYFKYDVQILSPDARLIAYRLMTDGKATVFVDDRETKKGIVKYQRDFRMFDAVCFSNDGRYMAAGVAGGTINIWDLQSKTIVYTLKDNNTVRLLKFSSNGDKLISVNGSDVINVWDVKRQILTARTYGVANIIWSLSLNSPGTQLGISGTNRVGYYQSILDIRGSNLKSIATKEWVPNLQYSPDGNYLVTKNRTGKINIYDAASGVSTKEFAGNNHDSSAFAISPDGTLLAICNDVKSSKISVYNFPGGEFKKSLSVTPAVHSLSFSKDSKIVFAGCSNNSIQEYNIETGARLHTMAHTNQYSDVTHIDKVFVAGDGNLITGDNVAELRWWNVNSGTETAVINVDADNSIAAIPGTDQIAVCGGETSPLIKLIDINSHKLLRTFKGHSSSATSLAVTKDGKFLISGSFDRTMKIWNVSTGEMLATLIFLNEKDWVIVDNEGRFDGTQEGMKQMYYVKGLETMPLESGFEKFYTPDLLPRILEGEKFTPTPVNIVTLKDAPKVKITAEEMQRNLTVEDDVPVYNTGKEQINIKVQADCPNDGVTEIRLFQNEKLVETTRNLVVEDENKSEKSATKTFAVSLSPGENRFKAIAFNTERTESKPVELSVSYKPAVTEQPAAATATLHLLVVGINTYKNPKYNLNYAQADAAAFAEAMKAGSQNLFTKTNSIIINDADATKDGITAAFEKIKAAAKPQDLFVFYYAGHGVMNDKKEFFLVPYDVTQLYGNDGALAQKGFSADALQQMSKDIKAQKQLFILDACQSAAALESVAGARGAAEEKAIAQLARSTGTYWLTASSSDQFASEFSQLGHGSFTYCLLQAFKGDANPGDTKLTVKILDAYLQTKVPEITQKYKGTVQYPVSYSYGNDFPIIMVK